jgi:hypothetical protein
MRLVSAVQSVFRYGTSAGVMMHDVDELTQP